VSGRRAKSQRQMGHPARAAAARGAGATKKGRPPQNGRPRRGKRDPHRPPPRAWTAARGAAAALRARLGQAWLSVLKGRSPVPKGRPDVTAHTAVPLTELTRTDYAWAAVTGAIAAVLFATVITGHAALGDSTEAVTGVSSLGVLHAPGYPAYVIAAHAFTLLVPVGSEVFRVSLFSLVCASLSVAGVQLLARRCGAARWAGSLGALALAAGAGFWFYSGFAKHDMFSGLIFLIALHLALAWRYRPTGSKLIGLAAVFAVGLGSSWPLMVLLLPTIAFVLFSARRRLSLRSVVSAAAAGLAVVVALGGFVMVRAAQNPAVNFDNVTSIGRLVELVTRADFTPHSVPIRPSATGSGSGGAGSPHADVTTGLGSGSAAITMAGVGLTTGVGNDGVVFLREIGIVGVLLAALGLIASLRRRRRGVGSYVLVITFAANLVGAAALVGPGGVSGYEVNLIEEGFLLGCYFVLAAWVAIGASELVAGVSTGGDRLAERWHLHGRRGILGPLAALVLAGAVLVPLVVGHWSVAHRAARPYADRLASAVFSELPPRAALLVSNSELTDPLTYRQVIYHQRRDVLIVDMYALSYAWYRELMSRRLGRTLPPALGDSVLTARQTAKWLSGFRPVYMDLHAAQVLAGVDAYSTPVAGNLIGYRPVGILAQLAGGSGPQTVRSPAALDQAFRNAERTAGMPDPNWNTWPDGLAAQIFYNTAALEVARAYYEHHDLAGMRRALLNELAINPSDTVARADLTKLTGG
jgi:hypothetical protein